MYEFVQQLHKLIAAEWLGLAISLTKQDNDMLHVLWRSIYIYIYIYMVIKIVVLHAIYQDIAIKNT